MKNIKLLNKIARIGLDNFNLDEYCLGDNINNPDGIMVRSADMLSMEFNPELKAIARAGAGVNNIPVDKCADQGIVVFNTPGANANGVKELAVAALLLASRNISGGIEWAKAQAGKEGVAKLVEKEKSKFAGIEIQGKTLGVIGLGAIGGMVANIAKSLGMEVIGYDPYITIENAWHLSRAIKKAADYDEIYRSCDFLTVHIPATDTTRGMFNAETFAKMKDGVRFINLSRADLVNTQDMIAAVKSGKIACYVTDFPTDDNVNVDDRIITIPHLGASTEESEDNCAVMAARQLIEYLETGNITNSVNFPNCSMPHNGDARICVLHKNIPNMLAQISGAVSAENINIINMLNRSKKEYAYTIMELEGNIPENAVEKLKNLDGVIRVNCY